MRNVSKTCSPVLLLCPNSLKLFTYWKKIQYYYRNQSGLSFCQNYLTDRKRHSRQEEDTTQLTISRWGGGWNRISWSDYTHSNFRSIAWQRERHKQDKTPPPCTISAMVFLYSCLSFTDVCCNSKHVTQEFVKKWTTYFLMVCLL